MRYIIEGRAGGHWIAIGNPHVEKPRAERIVELAAESGMWEDTRILVVNEEKTIIQVIQ